MSGAPGTLCTITYRLEADGGEVRAGDWLLTDAGSCYQVQGAHELPPRPGMTRWKLTCMRMGKRLPPSNVRCGLDEERPVLRDAAVLDARWWPLQWDRRDAVK